MYIDKRPVYPIEIKQNKIPPKFDDALYYYVKFIDNCTICLNYPVNPHILPCGHTFCKSCLENANFAKMFQNKCVQCNSSNFSGIKPCKFFSFDKYYEKNSSIVLRRLTSVDVISASSYIDNVFATKFYIDSNNSLNESGSLCTGNHLENPNNYFYQSNDGQLIFLNPITVERLKSKPKYIFGKIKHIVRNNDFDLDYFQHFTHLDPSSLLSIIDLY